MDMAIFDPRYEYQEANGAVDISSKDQFFLVQHVLLCVS